jgi:hypothetical protein
MQGVEIGDAVDAQDHGLAIDDELLAAVPKRGLSDPWEPLGRVMAAARDQADPFAVALHPETVTVILHLVEPLGAGGHGFADGGNAELELRHESEIGVGTGFWSRAI